MAAVIAIEIALPRVGVAQEKPHRAGHVGTTEIRTLAGAAP